MKLFLEKLPCLGYELATLSCDIFSNSSEVEDQMLVMTTHRVLNTVDGGDGDQVRGAGNIM
jgi:hypothetical protein